MKRDRKQLQEEKGFMAEPATVEPSDIEALALMLKENNGPLPLDALAEHYLGLLKERVTAETETTSKSA